jgi:hypothetical protein
MMLLLVTWSAILKTVPGTHVGPLYLHETFAQVQQTLGPAPVTKSGCEAGASDDCNPTMTYTDGTNTVVVRAHILDPYPSKIDPQSQNVQWIQVHPGNTMHGATISKTDVPGLATWTWESYAVLAPPPKAVSGWQRTAPSSEEVFFERHICGFGEMTDVPTGQVTLESRREAAASRGHWEFNLNYIEFAEGC